MNHQRTKAERAERLRARNTIIDAANQARLDKGMTKPFGRRSIQQAVCVVRRRALVKPAVLVAAGYQAEPRRCR